MEVIHLNQLDHHNHLMDHHTDVQWADQIIQWGQIEVFNMLELE